ncbi:MAG: alpha-glucosidase, partial [Oscillospiraceae bacterium]|nr:alpha-glucosidase [Oscillospiraceae bacterium]
MDISEIRYYIGRGKENISMYRGNFNISDKILFRKEAGNDDISVAVSEDKGLTRISLSCRDKSINRIWIRIPAEPSERVTGGGEQFSCLDLRGRLFPIWTREQGVGRNPLTEITRLSNESDGGGGDYHTTFFPQPTFVSSGKYFFHLMNSEYSELDFRSSDYHEVCVWANRAEFVFGFADSYRELLISLTGLLGRQPRLPDWAMEGVWLGVQGGTERVTKLLQNCRSEGMDVSAVWIQDWEGKRVTSFGKRLQWDWKWNKEMYPGLDTLIASDPATRWLGYINPYLVEGGALFNEAKKNGFFVKNAAGEDYLFDFGEFDCGVVDLCSEGAFAWYKNVIKENLAGMGFKGWMADFGEYLPADAVCAGGRTGLEVHNLWPFLWAKCNREAVEEAGLLGDCVFFMRSGFSGSGKYSTFLWAGDQCVDWSDDDGLPSVITAALTAGMSGFGLHGSDAGGYTSLFGLRRSKELLLRWLEFAAFTPIMRTHEGNRPESNFQVYSDEDTMKKAGRLSKLHTALLPYIRECVMINSELGVPVMRPLFFASEDSRAWERDNYSYLLGDDMLVAPVVREGANERTLWLPEGEWVYLWSGESFASGNLRIKAPLGKTPV